MEKNTTYVPTQKEIIKERNFTTESIRQAYEDDLRNVKDKVAQCENVLSFLIKAKEDHKNAECHMDINLVPALATLMRSDADVLDSLIIPFIRSTKKAIRRLHHYEKNIQRFVGHD